MKVLKKILFVMIFFIFVCFTGCKDTEVNKPFLKANTDYNSAELYYENTNKNAYNYTLENINDICSIEVSFEYYIDGELANDFQKLNEYKTKEKYRNINIGLTVAYPIIKDTGEDNILFAIKNDNYTNYISTHNFYNEITNYSIETKNNFYPEVETEYCLITFYADEKTNIESIDEYSNRNDFLINKYKYVYFLKIKYIDNSKDE